MRLGGRDWWVADHPLHPAGPAFRGRCLRCPWLGPIRLVPWSRVTDDVIEAAAHGHGPVSEAAATAGRDLRRHCLDQHKIDTGPPTREQITFELGRAP
jgi:hypothetical protein